jgi:hypothetical protein
VPEALTAPSASAATSSVGCGAVPTEPTYYTIADAPFFPGLVALLNSLRLSGNQGELVVLDRGLERSQRERLEPHARVVELPPDAAANPILLKPFPQAFDPSGVVVIVDSDMLVVRALDRLVERAAAGSICVFPDPIPDRWFGEWTDEFELRSPPRRQTYVNSGFVAFSVERWPDLLARWRELCGRIPPADLRSDQRSPFWAGDQDALNALFASELPAEALEVLPVEGEAYPEQLLRVRVLDERSLECELDGQPVTILHHSLGPKVWQRLGWLRLRNDAYVRLLPRLLFGNDVPLRLDAGDVPFRLRPGAAPRAVRRSLDAAHGGARAGVYATPRPLRRGLVRLRNRLFRRLGG